jgi:hypothetical protein
MPLRPKTWENILQLKAVINLFRAGSSIFVNILSIEFVVNGCIFNQNILVGQTSKRDVENTKLLNSGKTG